MVEVSFSKIAQLFDCKYYTTWSNILFYITIIIFLILKILDTQCQIPCWFFMAVLVNMIAVGIIGNIICSFNIGPMLKDAPCRSDGSTDAVEELTIANFLVHTIPLILAFIILLYYSFTCSSFNPCTALLFLFLFALIWLLIPYKGARFINKVNLVYLDSPLWWFFILPFIWALLLFSLNRCY